MKSLVLINENSKDINNKINDYATMVHFISHSNLNIAKNATDFITNLLSGNNKNKNKIK